MTSSRDDLSLPDPARTDMGNPSLEIPTGSDTAPAGKRWQQIILQMAILALAVLWIYSPVCNPTLPADWLWDDDTMLTTNLTVQHRLSADLAIPPAHAETLEKLWIDPSGPDFFPLTYTVLWAQWPFFSMDPRDGGPVKPGGPAVPSPFGYHLVSVLLHIGGALALWRLFAVMRMPGAWLGAMIFAVHPVCVESVAWISELKNTLSLPLFLLAAINYIHFDNLMVAGEALDSPRAARRYVFALLFFALAMLAKTSVVMLPVLILFYIWWKRGTVTGRDVVRSAHFFLISLVLGVVTIYYQHGRAIGDEMILVGGPASRLATAGMSVLWYLKLLVWPIQLLPIYERWVVDPPQLWQFLPWPLIIGAAGLFWWKRASWGRHAFFALGSFLVTAAPILGFITISYMRITWVADHFIYLPMIFIVGLVASAVARWYERAAEVIQPAIVIASSAVIAALIFLSFKHVSHWVNEDALWTYTLTHNDDAWQAHNRLGSRKTSRGHIENIEPVGRVETFGALHHFSRATALRPDLGETHNNLGTVYQQMARIYEQRGDAEKAKREMNAAIDEFKEASRLAPRVQALHVNLATALMLAGRFVEAGNKYKELISGEPNNASFINNYGIALFKQGNKRQEAIVQFRRALEIVPDQKDVKDSLAMVLADECKELLDKDPKNPTLINNYGSSLLRQGKKEEAVIQFRRALEITPDFKNASENLANALSEKPNSSSGVPLPPIEGKPGEPKYDKFAADSLAVAGRFVEAGDKYKELLTKEPNDPVMINNYGSILYKLGKKMEAIVQFRRALELAPDLKDAGINLSVALAEKPVPSTDTSPPPQADEKKPAQPSVPTEKNSAPQ